MNLHQFFNCLKFQNKFFLDNDVHAITAFELDFLVGNRKRNLASKL